MTNNNETELFINQLIIMRALYLARLLTAKTPISEHIKAK